MKRTPAAIAALVVALGAHATEGENNSATSPDSSMSRGAGAEEQLRQRLHERVRTIPDTDTQYLVGGYLQVDGIATRHEQDGDEQDTFLVSSTPFDPAEADYRLSVRQSQFNWLSRTTSEIGPVWTRLEANLFPLDGTTALALNQLFVRWDEHFVLGKTYSTFMDDAALPTTLDYNGPGGVTYVRQWLARGRLALGSGWAIEASIEEPQADLEAEGTVLALDTSADRPDLAARLRYEGEGSHLQVAGLSRRISANATSPLGTTERRVDGTGLSVSGSLALFSDDTLLVHTVTGKGVGRYLNDPLSATGLAVGTNGELELVRSSGATVYFQHQWAPDWTSVAGASTLWVSNDGQRAPESLRRIWYASANLIHALSPTLYMGAEALWGKATQVDGADATNLRLQFTLRYLIF